MKPKSMVLLALALSCGLVASIGISQVLDRKDQTPVGATQEIVVVLKDIKFGDTMTAQNVKLESWPKEKIPPGAITKLDDVLNRRPRITLYAGEPILEAKLIGADAGAAPEVPKGYRPVPVRVDEVSSSSGLILPGDTVDVLVFLTKNPGIGIYETTVRTILKKIKVFAVDQQFRREGSQEELNKARTVQLIVTPADAELLTLAAETGKIKLVLRNPGDVDEANDPTGATVADLGIGNGKSSGHTSGDDDGAKGKSLLDFLKGPQKPAEPVADAAPAQEKPVSEEFSMLILEGANDVREVTFADGRLPELKSHVDTKQAPSEPTTDATAPLPGLDH
jgi:pilus assembly protein CpaB